MATIRALKSQTNQATRRDTAVTVIAKDSAARTLIENNRDKLYRMAGLAALDFATDAGNRPGMLSALGTVVLEQSGVVDVAAETQRLTKELEKIDKVVAAGEAKLTNETFVSKAPPQILEGARKQLEEAKAKRDELSRMLKTLGS